MIRFAFRYLRPVAVFLAILVLFQCCKAYSLKSTSIEDAVGPQRKYVRVVTVKGEEILFDSIYYRNDKLYGIIHETKNTIGEEVVELKEYNILQVQIFVLNKHESNRRTLMLVLIPVVTIGSIVLFGWLMFKNISITL
jgi:hypothetical protein